MALYIFKEPTAAEIACSPVKNPIIYGLNSDSYIVTAGSKFWVRQEFITDVIDALADGDYLELNLDNVRHRFTFRDTPDDSGYELPLKGYSTNAQWADSVLEVLTQNPYIFDIMDITHNVGTFGGFFSFMGKKNGSPILIETPDKNFASLNIVESYGEADEYLPNYSAGLRLYCERNHLAEDYEKVVELYAFPKIEEEDTVNNYFRIDKELYDFMDKVYGENLLEALPYMTNYPDANHLIKQYKLWYNERYGSPATERLFKISNPYKAALAGIGFLENASMKIMPFFGFLHPSGKSVWNQRKQYVDKDQPAWVYFCFNPNDGNDFGSITAVKYRVYYSDDGTYNEQTLESDMSKFVVSYNNIKAFFLPAGYNQLDIGSGDGPSPEDGQAFKWEIMIELDEEAYLTKTFVLDCCSLYRTYLMYQNSLGGYDTVTVTAPKEYGLEIKEGEEVERILADDYMLHDSQFEATTPKVRQTVKCNIGFRKPEDTDVLKELLMSKRVFVCPGGSASQFIPVNIDRKTVQMESEDDYERNFSFEFSPAHEFRNFENTIWLKSK